MGKIRQRVGLAIAAQMIGVLLAGCGKSQSGPVASSSSNSSSNASETNSKSGYAHGRVTDANGQPIHVAGAVVEVRVSGVSSKGGENVTYAAHPDAKGNFEMKLADGRYQGSGFITVPFEGKTYRWDLLPTGPKPAHEDQDSGDGPVFNFEWHFVGPTLDSTKDEADFTQWFGTYVNVGWDKPTDPSTHLPIFPPKGTKFVIMLKPSGKLVDGSDGKSLTFERGYDDVMNSVDNSTLANIPLGDYTMSAVEKLPTGEEKPLVIRKSTEKAYSPTSDVRFVPAGIAMQATGQLYELAPPGIKSALQ